jgi:hypothetical protein
LDSSNLVLILCCMRICAFKAVQERSSQVCWLVILSINWVALESEFDLAAS